MFKVTIYQAEEAQIKKKNQTGVQELCAERVELINGDVLKYLVSNERKGDCHIADFLLLHFPRGA